jgi:hypothetical protein
MHRFRFTLSTLTLCVAFAALVFASLRSSSEIWSGLLFTLTAVILFVAVVGALYSRSTARAFWVGFALLGWGHWVLGYGPWFQTHVSPKLLTQGLAVYVEGRLLRPGQASLATLPQFSSRLVLVDRPVWRACHSVLTLLIALLGALVARLFYDRANTSAS